MESLPQLLDMILHVDKYLAVFAASYGPWIYAILFAVVFCETGLVITPFLPGDSLLFAVGALSGSGVLDFWTAAVSLSVAAIIGDSVNYAVGRRIGPAVFSIKSSRLLNVEHLHRAQQFYERHGGKTIVLARFMPIIRTLAPFVAGVGSMRYERFLTYNVVGGLVWIFLFLTAGHVFGGLAVVRENFSLVILAIIVLSVLPAVHEYLKARRAAQAQ